jgi:diguanylate cyclase (GGDEF)-like protein/PAS domain S-box-containing protein
MKDKTKTQTDDNRTSASLLEIKSVKMPGRVFTNPVYLMIITLASIFLAEAFVMFILSFLRPLSLLREVLLDSVLLLFIVYPVIYYAIFKPLQSHYLAERKQTHDTLRERDEQYRSLVESTDDSIYLVDRNYNYIFMNKKHLSRMGFSEDQLFGLSYSEFHSPDETKKFTEKIDKVFETGKSVQHEHRSRRDGKHFLRTLSPVINRDGEITAVTVLSKNITDHKQMEEQLRVLSFTDELTGIYNRRGFFTLAEQQLKLANRQKRGIFLLSADLDNLKKINDTYGHQEGDIALIGISKILKESFRDSDIIARIGGDEFVVIPIITTEEGTMTVSARLQKFLEIHNAKKDRQYQLSVSVGLAYYDPESPCSLDDLLVKADKLMYEQKRHKLKS